MNKYELIEHTADIGLRAYGKDLKQLFANAARGMFEIVADLKNVRTKQSQRIKLEAPNIEELFLSWLGELLYYYNRRGIIFKKFLVNELTEHVILAQAWGEKINPQCHRLKTEIKAATFHQLKVQKLKDKWQGEVIFDV